MQGRREIKYLPRTNRPERKLRYQTQPRASLAYTEQRSVVVMSAGSEYSLEMAADELEIVNGGAQVFQEDYDLGVRWQPTVKTISQKKNITIMHKQRKRKRENARASPLSDVDGGIAKNIKANRRCDSGVVTMPEVRIATWNIGTMTGRSAELSEVLERRHINICCVQETKWKGAKSRQIGKGFKIIYNGKENTRNGVGIVLDQYFSQNVIEINRISDRIMSVRLAVEKQVGLNIVCVYAPQVGCPVTDKQEFWDELYTHVDYFPKTEQTLICGDLNGHVGMGIDGFEAFHGGFGFGSRNNEGDNILEFAASKNYAIVNTFFKKKDEHLITYKSGNAKTQIDYILINKQNLRHIKDCKVIPGEPLTSQHRLLLTALKLRAPIKKTKIKQQKIRWQELNTQKGCDYIKHVRNHLCENNPQENSPTLVWSKFEHFCTTTAKNALGISKGSLQNGKDAQWWNNHTKDTVSKKKRLFKIWQETQLDEDKAKYKEAKKEARRTVAIEREKADSGLYKQLDLAADYEIYRIARYRHNNTKDFLTTKYIKNKEGALLTDDKQICKRWYQYYKELLNEEFPQQPAQQEKKTQGPANEITAAEIKNAISKMKNHKATGPDEIPVEIWKLLQWDADAWLADLFSNILKCEKMPDSWRKSVLVPFYKNKGDVRDCANFRGIKLTSHTLKIWERVLSERLLNFIKLTDNQYGFTAGKGTTDAIHAIRLLMERARQNKQNLWLVFIDLEKAFDRVPRSIIWQALRAHGVPECYIRLVADMYDNGQTSVRSPAGMSGCFDIKVGVHQGSALSPLLFNVVMNYLTAKIQKPTPWNLLYADDIALISENAEEIQEDLNRWRESLESNGLRISRTKTEYLVCNFNPAYDPTLNGPLKLENAVLPRVKNFKYLGSVVSDDASIDADITHRTTCGWTKWRTLTGVLCDSKMPIKTKGKVYKTAVRPALLYGSEAWAAKKAHVQKLHTAEMRMLRWSGGVTLKDKVRNQHIRGSFKVAPIEDKVTESRLRWYGHVMRRPETHVVKKCLAMATEKKERGRPQTTWLTNVRKDMKMLSLTENDVHNREAWRRMIVKADPA